MNDLRELTEILEDLNLATSFQDASGRLTRWARLFTGCQAAILRLLSEDGTQPWLAGCVVDGADGAFARDETVVHGGECMCGRVAIGAIDPTLPFFTDGGSFRWGRLSTLSTGFSAGQVGPIRDRCLREEYESLAIFPVRAGRRIVGSLHLADRRPDWFGEASGVVEAACRLAGDTLLRHKTREREQALLETIETALLPKTPPKVDGLDVGVSFTSATEMVHMGGDFYDLLDLGPAGILVLVGDVSGKGIDAVGTAAKARYAIEAQANLTPDPASFMTEANDSLARLLPPHQFVAVAACLIDRTTGSVTTCLAGHPPPLLLTSTGVMEIDAPHNPPLGVFAGRRFSGATCDLPADAVLLAYTDGVTDSRQGGGLFGQEGIARVVRALPDRDPDRIARSVCAAAAEFHDASLPGDDRLVVAISRSTA